jgi:hypothetical protein
VLRPGLQQIGDEQQPTSMDGLPVLHPGRQQIIDEQQPMLMDMLSTPQPSVLVELLPPPPLQQSLRRLLHHRSCHLHNSRCNPLLLQFLS